METFKVGKFKVEDFGENMLIITPSWMTINLTGHSMLCVLYELGKRFRIFGVKRLWGFPQDKLLVFCERR